MPALAFRNDSVRRLRRLAARRADRWEERLFVVEGAKVLSEAVAAGARVREVFIDPDRAGTPEWAAARDCGAEILEVQPGVLERACDASHGPPVAALVEMVDVPLASIGAQPHPLVVVCDAVQDPGNAGAVVRSAAAAGATGVLFSSGSVDIYNPKAVRSSAGALFHVPVVTGPAIGEVLEAMGRWGTRRLAAVSRGGRDYTSVDFTQPCAIVVGSEAHGLPPSVLEGADERVTVPIAPGSESLNVAMAATVLCFEAARQRRQEQP